MKKFTTIMMMLFAFLVGCTPDSSITSPVQSVQQHEPNWLVSLSSQGLTVNTILSASKLIDGSKGGKVDLKADIPGGPFGKIHIDSKLKVLSDSFTGTMTIFTDIDDVNLCTTFGPSYVFNKPLEYTLSIEGLDLSGINPDSIDFVYQSPDGSINQCEYSSLEVDVNKHKIKVNSAKLPHFSRYGFVRKSL